MSQGDKGEAVWIDGLSKVVRDPFSEDENQFDFESKAFVKSVTLGL